MIYTIEVMKQKTTKEIVLHVVARLARQVKSVVVAVCWLDILVICVCPALSRENEEKAPTSLTNDSLVLCVATVVEGERRKAPMSHNDSLVLRVATMAKGGGIDGSRGCCRWQQLFVLPVSN